MPTDVFSQLSIFSDLTDDQICLLESIFSMMEYKVDEVIFAQGCTADYLYIVISGEVAIIFKPDDGSPITVARVQNGGVFGWSAAFGCGNYTSGAVCIEDTRTLKVLGEDLKELHHNHPETGILVLERLAHIVAERLKNSSMHNQVFALLEHGLTNGIKPIGG